MGGAVVIESDLLDADARDGVLGPFQARIGGEGGAQIFELGWGQGMGGLDVDGHVPHSHGCGGTTGGRCGMNGPRSACRPSAGSTVRPGCDVVAGWPDRGYRLWGIAYGVAPLTASSSSNGARSAGGVARAGCRA